LGSLGLLTLSACADETLSGYLAESDAWALQGEEDRSTAVPFRITFPRKGHIEGAGICTDFTARQTAPYPWFALEAVRISATNCPEGDALRADQEKLEGLKRMTLAEISGNILILSNDDGEQLTFVAVEN
jgi:heat shock protein HslJ